MGWKRWKNDLISRYQAAALIVEERRMLNIIINRGVKDIVTESNVFVLGRIPISSITMRMNGLRMNW